VITGSEVEVLTSPPGAAIKAALQEPTRFGQVAKEVKTMNAILGYNWFEILQIHLMAMPAANINGLITLTMPTVISSVLGYPSGFV
jgi:hypothetical protein